MASIKNFGISGVSTDVQWGKSGARVVYGTFDGGSRYRLRNEADTAFMNMQVLDPVDIQDAATKNYVDTEIANISGAGSIADLEADLANLAAAGGYVDANFNFTAFSGTGFMDAGANLSHALQLLDDQVTINDNEIGNVATLTTTATTVVTAINELDADLGAYKTNVSASMGSIVDGEGNFSNVGLANTSMSAATDIESALIALDTAIEGKDTLAELNDTLIANVADNQILTYDGANSQWINSDDLFLPGELVVTGNASVSANLVLNADVTGTPTDNALIEVERGTEADVGIRWNESTEEWEFTNDGSTWIPFIGEASILSSLSVNDTTAATALSSLAYNSTSGVFTFDGVSVGDIQGLYTNGTGVFFNVVGDLTTISIGQDVSTTANVTFNDVTVNGTLNSDDITASTVTVTGNLIVNGTTTTVNTETINLADNIILLNSNETGAPSQDAGIEVERGTSTNVSLRWNETNDEWEFTNDGTTYYALSSEADVDVHVLRNTLTAAGTIGTLESVAGKSYVASKIVVNVTSAFTAGDIVISGATTGAITVAGDVDEETIGIYVIELDSGLTAGENITVAIAGTGGSATFTVEYYAV